MWSRSRSWIAVALAAWSACGGPPREPARPEVATAAAEPRPSPGHLDDPDLNRPPPAKLLAIDWAATTLATEADALALWQRIAPTGADWSDKLEEIPGDGDTSVRLALALLAGGNFTCVPAPAATGCAKPPIEVPEPAHDATLADPCLRRVLAMWAINQLDEDEVAAARDPLRAIVQIPPPESELTAIALKAWPEDDHAARLELLALAHRAGHRELVHGALGSLDEAHAVVAAQQHHIDGAFDLLSAEVHRPLFLAAITDDQLRPQARVQAISELVAADGKLADDTRGAIVRATRAKSCQVAAAAAQFLVRNGEKKFNPGKPRTGKTATMMRALCVLASYEAGQRADEPSFLLGYVPKKGLEVVTTTYDQYNDVDTDGDGDPKTERHAVLVPRDEVTLPEVEDMMTAFSHCTGTVCRSDDREFRFVFKGSDLLLHRLEVIERPPCKVSP